MHDHLKIITLIFVIICSASLCSCTTLSYYGQSISGQLELLRKREPIDELLATSGLTDQLRAELQQVLQIRDFASETLQLPDNDSYRTYADLGRPYSVWNVIAAPEFSLEPLKWCFLIVGCLPYRGYFSKQQAMRYAEKLRSQGYDVHVGGVSAYSTLGWFDDPLLNTMLRDDITHTARVIFHELAHQKIYIKNDAHFNEAFADSIALIGVRQWLRSKLDPDALLQFEQSQARESEFIQLILTYRSELESLYRRHLSVQEKRLEKSAIFNRMGSDYREIRSDWGEHGDYDAWFGNGINNAKLSAILTYRDLVADFMALFTDTGHDLQRLYARVKQLGQCNKTDRRKRLKAGLNAQDCQHK
ncbi:MAG: aminopeptidase [Proteobacteria bacterium]|nr:aminopeptidase [Pseudomonadota bacterium]